MNKYPIPLVPPGRKSFSYRPPGSRFFDQISMAMVQRLAIIANEFPVVQGGSYNWRPMDVAAGEDRGFWRVTWQEKEPKRTGYTITGLTTLGRTVLNDYFEKNPPTDS